MSLKEKNIDNLLYELTKREKGFRNRTIISIIILFLAGAIWLFWTNRQVERLRSELQYLQNQIDSKEKQIDFLEETLHEAQNFNLSKVELNPMTIKYLSYNPELGLAGNLFRDIKQLQYQNTEFNLNGKTPEEGFNSPSMISYILKENRYIEDIALNSSQLINYLPISKDELQSGDIIIYKSGYSMLYIKYSDPFDNNVVKDFSIGMTPFGILELKPDFADKSTILRPINKPGM
ncbi:hypothetical protein ACFS7Z_22695 [Pontibacter toksunensis]|uniref:Cell division protein FtsL n=1 Tax=Pontibacter toksunensis TaxID=1332631 RepID=A0ABW6BZP9_9BACT